jgi:hypothetical protein
MGRVYDGEGRLTHILCCVCFEFTRVQDLYVDDAGEKWDVCHGCASKV